MGNTAKARERQCEKYKKDTTFEARMFLTCLMLYYLQAFRALACGISCVLYTSKTWVRSMYWVFIFKTAIDLPTGRAKCCKNWDAGTGMLRLSQFLQLASKIARLLGEEKIGLIYYIMCQGWPRYVLP